MNFKKMRANENLWKVIFQKMGTFPPPYLWWVGTFLGGNVLGVNFSVWELFWVGTFQGFFFMSADLSVS